MLHHSCHDPGQVVLQALVATSGYYSSRRFSMVSNLFPILTSDLRWHQPGIFSWFAHGFDVQQLSVLLVKLYVVVFLQLLFVNYSSPQIKTK